MSQDAAASWLLQEALEHFEDDVLGAYELLWLLNGSDYELGDAEARTLARATIAEVLAMRDGVLVPLRWPDREEVGGGPVDPATLTDKELFEFTDDGVYYALMPSDGG